MENLNSWDAEVLLPSLLLLLETCLKFSFEEYSLHIPVTSRSHFPGSVPPPPFLAGTFLPGGGDVEKLSSHLLAKNVLTQPQHVLFLYNSWI